jgi:B9 domain-containing protein 1
MLTLQFFDSTFVCQGEGREVTRVQQSGSVRLTLNVVTKGMQAAGYSSSDGAIKTT